MLKQAIIESRRSKMRTLRIFEFEFEFAYKGFSSRDGMKLYGNAVYKGPSLANCNKQFMKENRGKLDYIIKVTCLSIYEKR